MEKRQTKRLYKKDILSQPRHKNEIASVNANMVSAPLNSNKKPKRIGRGPGSGTGTTAARGQKGQKARASSLRLGFEGGQMRLYLRMPKRGFKNIFKESYQSVNLMILQKLNLSGEVTPEKLKELGVIQDPKQKIKILGTGDIANSIKITADAASESAKEKIKNKGGEIILRGAKA